MKQDYIYIKTNSSISVFLEGNSHTADISNPNYNTIVKLVKKGIVDKESTINLLALFDTTEAIKKYLGDDITIDTSGVLRHNEEVVENVLTNKIVAMQSEGIDIEPMINFLVNLRDNPSEDSRNELMMFLEVNDMPITRDGHFLAYKSVRQDYKDSYSGKFDNSIGAICEMPREKANPDRNQTCSSGLHFAAKNYAAGFCSSGHLMVLKINPKDVVSIPSDYNNEKGRCCKYTVIAEVPMSKDGKDRFNTEVVID